MAALENIIKYFFAHDLLNYAHLMPVHLAQMNVLEHDDPTTWETLKSGDFVVAKSEVPFTYLFTDQSLEQEIKRLKLVSEDAKHDLQQFAKKGQKCFEEFIHDRLLPKSLFGIQGKKLKLKTFSNWMEKSPHG